MMQMSAELSSDGLRRTRLDRSWGNAPGRLGWFMCNPSTADHERNDHTVTKCIGFAARWGYTNLTVLNPWDFRTSDPMALLQVKQPCSERNEQMVMAVARELDLLICAWGCESTIRAMRKRGFDPLHLLRRIRHANPHLAIECLGMSKTGTPFHPLTLAYDTPRIPFEVPA